MAKGDVAYRPGRGGGYGGGSSHYYDDGGRGSSKDLWEWFEENFTQSGFSRDWLLQMCDAWCYRVIRETRERYGLFDVALYSYQDMDTRARRLVSQKLSLADWNAFHEHLKEGYNNHKKELAQRQEISNQKYRDDSERRNQQREANVAKMRDEDLLQNGKATEISAGMLRSDFSMVLRPSEVYDRPSGYDIDDVVSTYHSGSGFSDETSKAKGIKLQITLSLDLSNSMFYNGVHTLAAHAFRDIGLTLKQLEAEFPVDLFIAMFTFSDGTGDSAGRRAMKLQVNEWYKPKDDMDMFELEPFRASIIDRWGTYDHDVNTSHPFTGEDTFIDPLFMEIEKWETKHSDPGAVRLDIVLTDAVLEHKQDIRDASATQERRDGALQTIFLNFMDEKEWSDGTLPRRCVQYKADRDNVSGMLRTIIQQFVGAYL
jgi:hypothetical protein